jgi:hypothetical protein
MFPIYFCKSSTTTLTGNQSKSCAIYNFSFSGGTIPPRFGGVSGISCDFAGNPYTAVTANNTNRNTSCVIAGSLTPITLYGGTVTITFVSNCT